MHQTLSQRFPALGTEDEFVGVCAIYTFAHAIDNAALTALDARLLASSIQHAHPTISPGDTLEIATLMSRMLAPTATSLSLPVPDDDAETSFFDVIVRADDIEFAKV